MKLVAAALLVTTVARADAIMGTDVFVEDRVIPDKHDDGTERYVQFGVLSAPSGGWFGIRLQLDAWSLGGFSIGGAGTLFARGDIPDADQATLKGSGVGFLAYTSPLLPYNLRLRAQLGYGEAFQVAKDTTTMSVGTTSTDLVEGALFLTMRGNHDWSVTAGPIVQRASDSTTTAMVFLGLQRRF
ncbi:MAG TPA: hypothetical protein VGC41_25285 [Kofleriaceae bacterium]